MKALLVLAILDGWGVAPKSEGNAVAVARTPNLDRMWSVFPHTLLQASGEAVGLPHGEDGNTETGHLNIGAGQIVYQNLPRINMAIADGTFFQNPAFINAVNHVIKNNGKLHLLGLIGSGGVHSNVEHLYALMRLVKQRGLDQTYLHLITDGRDSPPTSALTYIAQVKQQIDQIGLGKIATIMGRYWAMDRDHRWERTQKAYLALTMGSKAAANSAEEAVNHAYENQQTDEFIEPTTIVEKHQDTGIKSPVALIAENDAVIFINFRIDRPRQITKAFVLPDFKNQAKISDFDPYSVKYHQTHLGPRVIPEEPFDRGEMIRKLYFVTMTRYEKDLPVDVAFPPVFIKMPLGRVLAERGIRQLRVSETEKERFVTYYFNGQREESFPGEDRIIVPSPKVATYDLQPEMSTPELERAVVNQIKNGIYDVIVVNVACPDMVAHTGNMAATVKACEAADGFIGSVAKTCLAYNGNLLITADHGNAEEIVNLQTGNIDTEHSTFPVPFIMAGKRFMNMSVQLKSGVLADIAPTILKLLGIEIPQSMTGKPLI